TTRACVRTVSSGLRKLSPCQTAAVDRRTAPARTKRRSPPHPSAWNARPCDTGAETVRLHWLPVHLRLKHKLCTMMHSIHTGQCPAYLANMVHFVVDSSTRPGLRSADTTDYRKPR